MSLLLACLVIPVVGQGADSSSTHWKFVSSPDFLNVDVGDLSALPGYTGKNSINASWQLAMDTFLDAVEAEEPEFVAVAGDLVMARWFQDAASEGLFGPTKTSLLDLILAEEEQRVVLASDLYYTQWKERFESRGLHFYTAVGDHEMGDDYSWNSGPISKKFSVPEGEHAAIINRQTVDTHRDQFATYFVDPLFVANGNMLAENSATFAGRPAPGSEHERSAYAIKHRNLLLVSVDVFTQESETDLPRVLVRNEQLAWLEQTLDAANADPDIDFIIVQGHTPVLLVLRGRVSGKLHHEDGELSEFWSLMKEKGVDFYFSGEVHDVEVSQIPGEKPIQIVHGGIMGFPNADTLDYGNFINYLVADVFENQVRLTIKKLDLFFPYGETTGRDDPSIQFFQPGNPFTAIVTDFTVDPDPDVMGSMLLMKDGNTTLYRNCTGVFSNVAPCRRTARNRVMLQIMLAD